MKKIDEEESEKRIAYEISVSKLEYLESQYCIIFPPADRYRCPPEKIRGENFEKKTENEKAK